VYWRSSWIIQVKQSNDGDFFLQQKMIVPSIIFLVSESDVMENFSFHHHLPAYRIKQYNNCLTSHTLSKAVCWETVNVWHSFFRKRTGANFTHNILQRDLSQLRSLHSAATRVSLQQQHLITRTTEIHLTILQTHNTWLRCTQALSLGHNLQHWVVRSAL